MISAQQLSLHFGGQVIFEDIHFTIRDGERVGLVGKNGAGKSTLLRILNGDIEPDGGNIVLPKGDTIGFLRQELSSMHGRSVFEETVSAFDEALAIQQRMEKITTQLEQDTDPESDAYIDLLNEMHELSHHYELMDVGSIDKQVEVVLTGLGFQQSDLDRQVETFSGGWQMRIELAKILLRKPHVVLLDEPTNHLYIESIQWLEQYLTTYPGAILLVSHDRSFLDKVTNRTIEIVAGKIYDYPANYSAFTELRKERIDQQSAAQRNQEKMIQHTEQLIEKFMAKASKAKFAQSLIHKLDKMDKIEVDDEETSSISFHFPQPPRSGKLVLEVEQLGKSYGNNEVLRGLNLQLERGEKIALVGRNGEGKSTLSRIVAGKESFTGTCRLGHNVTVGYYAQNQADMLNGDETVYEVIDGVAVGEIRTKIRNLLAAFLFRGDDIYKKVSVLSGGEKSRLALCRMLLEPANLLIMDEPTNHLDMRSKDVLKQALMRFEGTIILVSHDRDFLAGMTNKVVEVANKVAKEYIGDIYDFIEAKNKTATLAEKEVKAASMQQKKPVDQKSDYQQKKVQSKELRKIERQVAQAEASISELEASIAKVEAQLKDPDFFKGLAHDAPIFAEYETLKMDLEKKMEEWAQVSAELEKMQA